MNSAELLDQFVVEARECLEQIGAKLLAVEREPDNTVLLNDLFRSVHTLKGNCGLFDFKSLEAVVHAAEDLLDRLRSHELVHSLELADALLDAMDHAAALVEQIARSGAIETGADSRTQQHVASLRALLGGQSPAPQPSTSAAELAAAAPSRPAWLDGRMLPTGTLSAVRYQPEAECFFKGEDPWRLAMTTPGLLHIELDAAEPWPSGDALDDWDCYRCNLIISLFSSAPGEAIAEHFRCVSEQVELVDATEANDAPPLSPYLAARTAKLWRDQLSLLSMPGVSEGSVAACARSLRGLLCTRTPAEIAMAEAALALASTAGTLRAWAEQYAPALVASALADGPAPTDSASRKPPPAEEPASERRVLKVSQEKIDALMDLVGEMVVAKNSLPYLAQRAELQFGQRELAREIKAQYAVINRITEDMQHAVMKVRMLPLGAVFQRFSRLVRDISKRLGKEVSLLVEGEDTEADKNVIEPLADPLIHIIRNSLDHGIEMPDTRRALGKAAAGTIRIKARQEGDRVLIEISDDGAGIDPARVRQKAIERGLITPERALALSDQDAIQLVFAAGFSTAEQVSDLSGRGVGMDVVRSAVERINGGIKLSSQPGQGTTISLSLPLSMAVSNVMVVESAGRRFGVPMDLIVETVRIHADDIHHFKQAQTTVLRGRIVPLRALNQLLAIDAQAHQNADGEHAVLVVRIGAEPVGLLVDQFHGSSDIIVKPLEGVLAGLTGIAGTALMGDGSVLMVLNPKELL